MEVIDLERRLEMDARRVQASYAGQEAEMRIRLTSASADLDAVRIPDAIRTLIALLCIDGSVAGHRADLVVARAARATCSLRWATAVELTDVLEAPELALPHPP